MLQPIFTTEVTTLEAQVAEWQAAIAIAQQQIVQFSEVQGQASTWIETGINLKKKIGGLSKAAIAEFRQNVLRNLFGDNDSLDGNDGGNQPSPAPTPQDGGGTEVDTEQEEIAAKDPQGNPALESTVELATNFQSELEARGIQKYRSAFHN